MAGSDRSGRAGDEGTVPELAAGSGGVARPAAGDGRVGRRVVLGAAALAAPAVALSVATPARAASAASTLTVTAPAAAAPGDVLSSTVFATVLSRGGFPVAGEQVVFTVSPGTVGSFPGNALTFTGVTDATGRAFATGLSAKAAGTLTVTATNSGHTATARTTVTAPTGTIAFTPPTLTFGAGTVSAVNGQLTRTGGSGYPTTVDLTYSGGYTGPATAAVNPTTGAFTVPGVTAPAAAAAGQGISASAPGFGTGNATFTTVLGYISLDYAGYAAYRDSGNTATNSFAISGRVNTVGGAALPATVSISYPSNVNAGPATVPVNADGTFTIPRLTPHNMNGGAGQFLTVSAANFLQTRAAALFTSGSEGGRLNATPRCAQQCEHPARTDAEPGRQRRPGSYEHSLQTWHRFECDVFRRVHRASDRDGCR